MMNNTFILIALVLATNLIVGCQNKTNEKIESISTKFLFDDNNVEKWTVYQGDIDDGDTIRAFKHNQELNVRFCGIDAPELKQPLGIESKDYLGSLINRGNGTVYILPIEQDKYERTVGDLWILDTDSMELVHLNTAMIEAGYAWHYNKYSGNCQNKGDLKLAEKTAKKKKIGIWNGDKHQAPWEWRKKNR